MCVHLWASFFYSSLRGVEQVLMFFFHGHLVYCLSMFIYFINVGGVEQKFLSHFTPEQSEQ